MGDLELYRPRIAGILRDGTPLSVPLTQETQPIVVENWKNEVEQVCSRALFSGPFANITRPIATMYIG